MIDELRERIAEIDRAIVAAVNRRLELVAELRRYKEEHGIDFVDPERERWLSGHLAETNPGPLSNEGLQRLHAELLALVKRELAG